MRGRPARSSDAVVRARRWCAVKAGSGDLVNGKFLRDAAQLPLLRDRNEAAGGQEIGGFRVLDDRTGGKNRTRRSEPLDPRGDVDSLTEIILPVVEHDGKA